jgi:hypothetical protein
VEFLKKTVELNCFTHNSLGSQGLKNLYSLENRSPPV